MKIDYFANCRLPTEKAHGYQISKMAESFGLAGATVNLIISVRRNPNFWDKNLFDFYRLKRTFSVVQLKSWDPVFLLNWPAGFYIKVQGLIFSLRLFSRLFARWLSRSDFGAVYYTRDEYLLPLLQLFSRRVVWEAHSLPRRKKIFRFFFRRCFRLIVLTERLKRELVELGVPPGRILVAPDAVDLKVFQLEIGKSEARRRLNLPADKKIICYTGSFRTKGMPKGVEEAVKALEILNLPEIFFLAVGGRPEEIENFRRLAETRGLAGQTFFLGRVSREELAIYQRAADILVMPFPDFPHYAYYMSPLKMFEYLAAGRPIIASNLPAVREILSREYCFFCRPGDPGDLAAAIKGVLSNSRLADKLSANSRRLAGRYCWSSRAEKIIEFLGNEK